MNRLCALGIFLVTAALLSSSPSSWAQEPPDRPVTASQQSDPPPATQSAEPDDPQRSPRSMVGEFFQALGDSEKTPERLNDAVRCLDLSELEGEEDPEAIRRQGALLAQQLGRIVDALLSDYGASREDIPKSPDGDTVFFPAQGDVQLIITRGEDDLWRFSAGTIAAVPDLLESVKQKQVAASVDTAGDALVESVPENFRSARATMRTFIEAMNAADKKTARSCLDLSDLAENVRDELGSDLAFRLKEVIDRIKLVEYVDIPDRPDGESYIFHVGEHGRIELDRQAAGDRKGYWLFTKPTVSSIPDLYEVFKDEDRVEGLAKPSFWRNPRSWVLDRIPSSLKSSVLGLDIYEWVGIVLLLVLGCIVQRVSLAIFCALARPIGRSRHVELLPSFVRASVKPLSILVMVATWWGGLQFVGISPDVQGFVWPALKFVMTVVGVWASYRLIDLLADFFAARAAKTTSRLDDVLVPLLRKTAKIIVIVIGVIYIIKAIGVGQDTVNKLFAGVGLGGLAFALAAKDTIANFFGSITVVLDRPFQVGDWVKVGSHEGTVEEVGLRSSRLRTFYNSQVTIPNADLMTATVDNMGRRQYRRISCKLAVTYSTTPEQLEAFCEGIRELIRRHPFTRKDYYLVWVNEFADSSINILLYCFHETPDWVTELRERHRLFLDVIRLARKLDVAFAFPTQTIHLAKDDADPTEFMPKGDASGKQAIPKTPPTREPLEWGREEAAAIAKASIGDSSTIPSAFEFPKAE
ncbi:MAG: mechanosensitive ion channel family protein [Planctomycetota bacterium]